ncbi:type II toxin-antitoxin system RelE/ParE family toxin [Winogradskyella forsetii]|uniref:type II toxin-antitoxin system RelE/ParE family toxin n=1 Tax=Winogradskyella forsetii TaxID=2686077 RepID=UPI0015BDC3A2|nr:type II toxin-antitoxin system RelE/ParE family toxin [Winogradskyella forsetii]
MKVSWTPYALESYESVIDQLFINWNIDIVERFENEIEALIEKIEKHNYICPKSKIYNLHRCVINKHNSLVYRLKDLDSIEIILVIFNKSEHIF